MKQIGKLTEKALGLMLKIEQNLIDNPKDPPTFQCKHCEDRREIMFERFDIKSQSNVMFSRECSCRSAWVQQERGRIACDKVEEAQRARDYKANSKGDATDDPGMF